MLKDLDKKPKEFIEFLYKYAIKPFGFLLIAGGNGVGKSFSAMSIYEEICPYKLPEIDPEIAIFIRQDDLAMKLENTRKKWGDTDYLWNELCNCKLLILDDLGMRSPSPAFMDFLNSVSDKRYSNRHNKGTILTTNLTMSEMREKFGDAFVSRVASGTCFRLEGQDRRFDKDLF